jgi:hypothetical protein
MHYRIDQNTLREKIIDKTLYNDELKLYLRSISIKDSDYAHYCSRLGDLYRINGELTLAKLY